MSFLFSYKDISNYHLIFFYLLCCYLCKIKTLPLFNFSDVLGLHEYIISLNSMKGIFCILMFFKLHNNYYVIYMSTQNNSVLEFDHGTSIIYSDEGFLGQAVRVANLYLLSSHCVTPSNLQYAGRSTQILVRVLPSPVIVGYPSYGQGQWDVTNDETLYCMMSVISRTISFDKHTL